MKYFILLPTLLLAVLSTKAQHNPFTCKDHNHLVDMEKHKHSNLTAFKSNPLTDDYNLVYNRCDWYVDPAVNYIEGKVMFYFIPKTNGFSTLNLDLRSNMQVNSVQYHGSNLTFTLNANDNLAIQLPASLNAGQLDSLEVDYEGEPTQAGFGSFITDLHNGMPVMWTLSQPYGAKTWWPCKQSLDDKIDSIDIIVRTPTTYRVASNGVLVNEIIGQINTIYHWKHRYPIAAYLVAIAATNYASYSDFVPLSGGGQIEVLNYVYPEYLSLAQASTPVIVDIMTLFNQLFGDYPYSDEKYGHAQFGWGGGMEHQTMSFMGSFSFDLQAHELAHQWFGNKVTCGAWEDLWLNEGFATYLTGLSYQYIDTAWWDVYKNSSIGYVTSQPDGSVWVNDTTDINRLFDSRLTYYKGAMLLHMLRWKMGDTNFFQALRNYLNDPDLAFGYARTIDLQAHLESVSGQNLTEFFDDWYYGQGHPSYTVTWSSNGPGIDISLSQSTSHNSVDFYEMPVPIQVFGGGQDSILRLDHSFSGQSYSISLPYQVDSIKFDPERWLVCANNLVVGTESVPGQSNLFSLQPNPADETLRVLQSQQVPASLNIEIMQLAGQSMYQNSFSQVQQDIDISTWPSGLYLVKVSIDGHTQVQKVLVH
jgi:aminopeptidase N